MKVIKKIVPTLVAIMITISLAACNTNNTDTSKKTANETAQDNLFLNLREQILIITP